MSNHPLFLIVRAKIAEAKKAIEHMKINDAHQKSLAETNPALYSQTVHAESMATNVQGIYTHFESILKSLTNAIDGFTPSGESSHRDLLLQVSVAADNRDAMIQSGTLTFLTQLLRFRHAVRNNYAEDLRSSDVFENVALLENSAVNFFEDLEQFMASFEKEKEVQAVQSRITTP